MQIKICGLTIADQAKECVELGADAIGLIFYPPSPRNISISDAVAIRDAIGDDVALVGVFVDMSPEKVMAVYKDCRLNTIQLHGDESPEYVRELAAKDVRIVKALKSHEALNDAARYKADAFLLELGKGVLPGGNGADWDFSSVSGFDYPFALAGGINPDNIAMAINGASPQAIDLSSSVESAPGIKDMAKVKEIIDLARELSPADDKSERVF